MKRFRDASLIFLVASSLGAQTSVIDRIAALVDRQVITVSEINQMAEIQFFPRTAGQSEDDYRHSILESLIAQALRYRDVERFGTADISKDDIESRLQQIEGRFASPADFTAALQKAELSLDEVRALIKRQLQVESYIQERFAPMIFVSSDQIEAYYRGPYAQERRKRGLPVPPLATVTDEIRTQLKSNGLESEVARWTTGLRSQANVDIYTWR